MIIPKRLSCPVKNTMSEKRASLGARKQKDDGELHREELQKLF
jgi:hypothetical protein